MNFILHATNRMRTSVLCLIAVALGCAGCAGGNASFVHPDVDFSHIQKCAVLPFQNLTSDTFADDRIQSIFLMELLDHSSIVVVDPEETVSAMKELRMSAEGTPSPEQLVALGKALSVEGVFLGKVEEYGQASRAQESAYYVTTVFSLAETETGGLIWRSQVHVDGSSAWKKLFGGDSASLYDVSKEAVQKALGSLF